ncbi:MAG: hypothetical protein H0U92_08010 [Actinobacteria bacterium]|nr:hypothetical protein [Actinomycetota bacterium]
MKRTFRSRVGVLCVSVGLLLVGLAVFGPTASAAVESLAGWTQQGSASGGSWQVAGNGSSVTQTQSGSPTYFVGPKTMNAGSFVVDITPNGADDDYIGVLVGYLQPSNEPNCGTADCINNFVLIDWKRTTEAGGANEGMSLMRVNGNFNVRSTNTADQLPCFWKHVDDPAGCTVIKTDFGAGKGWAPDMVNRLRVTYSSSRVKVEKINPSTSAASVVFDEPGSFPIGGRFGFYNYAQATTTYSIADVAITDPAQPATTTSTTATRPTTTIRVGGAPTTAAPTSTAVRSATRLRTTIVRTGNDSQATTIQLLAGAALVALGALLTAARGRRPEGRFFS